MAQFGSANIGGPAYVGVWSGKAYQDPIGATALPNQGVGPYGANSLNGHIGANWNQGPVLPPANDRMQTDHGPAADNFNGDIFWQEHEGIWTTVANATPPIMGGFFPNGNGQYVMVGNPANLRILQPADALTFVAVRGAPAAQTYLNGATATVVAPGQNDYTVLVTLAPPPVGIDLNGLAGTWSVAP